MSKLTIFLLSSPTIIGSMLLMLLSDKPATAAQFNSKTVSLKTEKAPLPNIACDRADCTGNNYLAKFPTANQELQQKFPHLKQDNNGVLLLEVTEEESDTAVALFGCDCVKAVNALRQMRGIPIGVEGDKILPGPTINPCTRRAPGISS